MASLALDAEQDTMVASCAVVEAALNIGKGSTTMTDVSHIGRDIRLCDGLRFSFNKFHNKMSLFNDVDTNREAELQQLLGREDVSLW